MTPERRSPPNRTGPQGATLAPHRWCGECDRLLGPFGSEHAARAFTGLHGAAAAYEVYRFQLLRKREHWYLHVTRERAPSSALPLPPT